MNTHGDDSVIANKLNDGTFNEVPSNGQIDVDTNCARDFNRLDNNRASDNVINSAEEEIDINVKDNDEDSENNDFRSISSPSFDNEQSTDIVRDCNQKPVYNYSSEKTMYRDVYDNNFYPINYATNNIVKYDNCPVNFNSVENNFQNYYFNISNVYNDQLIARNYCNEADNFDETPCDLSKYNHMNIKENNKLEHNVVTNNSDLEKTVHDDNELTNNNNVNNFSDEQDNQQPINFAYYHF